MTRKTPLFDLRFTILVTLQVIVIAGMGAAFFKADAAKEVKAGSEYLRDVAAKLHSAGVTSEAISYYEKYLQDPAIDPATRATISYSIGDLYEKEGQPERALSWYYQVELSNPDSQYKADAAKRIVALLESMKKFSAARHALANSTALENNKTDVKGAVVVAKIGSREIYLHEVEEALDNLPSEYRSQFTSREGKINFARKYVADELLYEKAKRLGYDEKPDFRKKLDVISKQLLVQKILEEEVSGKVTIDPNDVKNYFEANREKYTQKEKAAVSLIKVKSKDAAEKVVDRLKKGEKFADLAKAESTDKDTSEGGGEFKGDVVRGEAFLTHPAATVDRIFATAAGKWTEPVLSQGAYYVFLVRKKTPEYKPKYDEVKQRVEFDYRLEKSQNLYQNLVEEALSGEDVKILTENVK